MARSHLHLSVLFLSVWLFAAFSCKNPSGQGKASATDTSAVVNWTNPRKGKVWEKENVVKIPLSAYENHLLGKVKSVSFREYELPYNTDSLKVLTDTGFNEYSAAGYLVHQFECDAHGVIKLNCTYLYNTANKPTEWRMDIPEDHIKAVTTFSYDDKGKRIEEITRDSVKENSRRIIYKYDNEGNETESDIYDLGLVLQHIVIYKYDKKGYQVGYGETGPTRKFEYKMFCEYDDKGNKTGGADYRSDTEVTTKWTQVNDVHGRRIETDYYLADGTLLEKRYIKYDAMGYPVEYTTRKRDGSLDEEKSYAYQDEYDAQGNIIRQTEIRYQDGKKIAIAMTEYVITYY